MQVACGLRQEVSVGRVSEEARARHRRRLLCAKSKHRPVCEDRASQSRNGTFILLVDAGLYEFVMALLRKDSSFDVVCAAPNIFRYLPMFMELLQLERPYSMSRYPYRLPTFCFIYRLLQYRISLFCSQATHSPPTLLSLPLSKGADHLRKRYHLERLLMLLRLEDEDPTSSMVVSKVEPTRKTEVR